MGLADKAIAKSREQAGPLVQSGESVKHAVPVTAGSIVWAAFGALGAIFMKPRIIATTESALYVIKGGKPGTVEERYPLQSTSVTAGKGFPVGRLRFADKTVWVSKVFQGAAQSLAADAQG